MSGEVREPFHRVGYGLRRMYLESECATPAEFLRSLECPDDPAELEENP